MKHVKLVGLCLLAVFALAAVAATAAQAEGPEWGRCVKLAKDKGKYKDANCSELEGKTNGKGVFKAKAKGFYEWEGNANTTCYEEPGKKGKYKNNPAPNWKGRPKKASSPRRKRANTKKSSGAQNSPVKAERRNYGRQPFFVNQRPGILTRVLAKKSSSIPT